MIGSYLALEAFRGDALGKSLSIGGIPYTVVGILAQNADNTEGSGDDKVYIPYENAQRLQGGAASQDMYLMTSTSRDTASAAKGIIENRLQKTYQSTDYYMVMTSAEMMDAMNTMMNTMMIVLVAIAAISLLVGGIGIMNIMYVSVTERTREIGLRMSIGAKGRHILWQFLIEAVIISVTGGVIGVVLGITASAVIKYWIGWPVYVQLYSVVLSFAVCTVTGIFFGWYPARKASNLDPIEAIRYE